MKKQGDDEQKKIQKRKRRIIKPNNSPSMHDFLSDLMDNKILGLVIYGHLMIEALIVELIETIKEDNEPWKMGFNEKVNFCIKKSLIPNCHRDIYNRLNAIRNNFAHSLGYKINYEDLVCLARKMADVGFDFSDLTVFIDTKKSFEWYDYSGIINEIFSELYCDLAMRLYDKGNDGYIGG